jgi:hypothetical protein
MTAVIMFLFKRVDPMHAVYRKVKSRRYTISAQAGIDDRELYPIPSYIAIVFQKPESSRRQSQESYRG